MIENNTSQDTGEIGVRENPTTACLIHVRIMVCVWTWWEILHVCVNLASLETGKTCFILDDQIYST